MEIRKVKRIVAIFFFAMFATILVLLATINPGEEVAETPAEETAE